MTRCALAQLEEMQLSSVSENEFWLYMVTWHTGLFIVMLLGQVQSTPASIRIPLHHSGPFPSIDVRSGLLPALLFCMCPGCCVQGMLLVTTNKPGDCLKKPTSHAFTQSVLHL
eukprot:1153281-Pelagomonas_calceolata.AAC.2